MEIQTAGASFGGDYAEAVDRFIAEENYHAELLARLVRHLGGDLLDRQWSNSAFRWVRGLLALEFNIQVLLTAEIVAEAWYGLLASRCGDAAVSEICAKITRDEVRHIAFHLDFYRFRQREWGRSRRIWWARQFSAGHAVALALVWHDHHRCLRALGISRREFFRRGRACCRSFLRRAVTGRSGG